MERSSDLVVVVSSRSHQRIVVLGVLVAVEEARLDIPVVHRKEHYVALDVDHRTLASAAVAAIYDDQACRVGQAHFPSQVSLEIQVEL